MTARLFFTTAGILLCSNAFAQETPIFSRLLKDTRPLPGAGQPVLTFGAVADKILPSVVFIGTAGGAVPGGPAMPAGSGFIISTEGHILTTHTVVSGPKVFEVLVRQEGVVRAFPAQVLGSDPVTDVALLKISVSGLAQAILGDSSLVRSGDAVLAAGAAMRPHGSAALGSVKGVGLGIETDIRIGSREAGGPLVDALGRVIGITIASSTTESWPPAGSAIPINTALTVIERFMGVAGGTSQRGFLGIQIGDLPPAQPDSPPSARGVLVQMIGGGSPAEKAGVQVGDVIAAINGETIHDSGKLRQIVSTFPPGAEISIDLWREAQPLTLKVVLTALPAEAAAAGPQTPVGPSAPTEILPGLTTENLTPESRRQQATPAQVSGILVTQLAPNSRAAVMGIQQGDIITQVNRKAVSSVEEALAMAQQSDKTVLIKVYRRGDSMLFMVTRE